VYTATQPFSAHHIFPCFDQPDIKGGFKFTILAPESWKVVSCQKSGDLNESGVSTGSEFKKQREELLRTYCEWKVWAFKNTVKLSTHSVGFAAGTFEEIKVTNERIYKSVQTSIFVRKGMGPTAKSESDEIFEIVSQGLRSSEDFFKGFTPIGKLHYVFLPFMKFNSQSLFGCPFINEEMLSSFRGNIIF
jgi:aminopeptidase N